MSQAWSTLSLTHGFRLTGCTRTQMLMPSLDASPGFDLYKRGDSLCSLHATYMLSKNPPLICTSSLYVVDKKHSFLDFALPSEKRQTENHRVRAKAQEDDGMEDDWEHLQTEFLTSFPEVSNGKPKAQEKMNHKHIKTDAVSVGDTATFCLKSNSEPKEDIHDKDKGQTFQMSDAKSNVVLDKVLNILRKHGSKKSAAPSRDVLSTVQSSNGKPPYKMSYAQSVVTNGISKPKDPSHANDKSAVDSILNVLQKLPPVVREEEQVASISVPPENSGFADDSFNIGHDDEKQLKSVVQHAASYVPGTSGITAMKVGESQSLKNDNALQLDSSLNEQFDPSKLKLLDLKIIARAHGVKYYTKMKKAELLEILKKLPVDNFSMYK